MVHKFVHGILCSYGGVRNNAIDYLHEVYLNALITGAHVVVADTDGNQALIEFLISITVDIHGPTLDHAKIDRYYLDKLNAVSISLSRAQQADTVMESEMESQRVDPPT